VKVKFKILFLIFLVALASSAFVYSAQSLRPFRGFSLSMPQVVEVAAGQQVTINGSILNFGLYWLHHFNLTVSGVPDSYSPTLTPNYFPDLRILRDWDPVKGLHYVSQPFNLTLTIPNDSSGAYTVTISGQEYFSSKHITNSTSFILKVTGGAPVQPSISISDIFLPSNVVASTPFNITFDVMNEGTVDVLGNVSVNVPQGWGVNPALKAMTLRSNSSEAVIFTLTPANNSGDISVMVQYSFLGESFSATKEGPTVTPQVPGAPSYATGWTAFLNQLKIIPTWAIAVIIVVIVILVWYIYKTLRKYKIRIVRGKPEEIVEVPTPAPV
jgi:hypothetical protein